MQAVRRSRRYLLLRARWRSYGEILLWDTVCVLAFIGVIAFVFSAVLILGA